MTRQSKNARKLAKAREITRMHKNGEKGPARTEPKHGKRWTYRSNPDTAKRLAEIMSKTSEKKSVLDNLNEEKAAAEKLRKASSKWTED